MAERSTGPQPGDIVEVRLTGTITARDGDDRVYVMLWHPDDGSQLIELSFPADYVVILTEA